MSYFSCHPVPRDARRAGSRPPEPHPAAPGSWPGYERALAAVNRDLAATLPEHPPLILMTTPAGGPAGHELLSVALPDGRWHGNPVHPQSYEDGTEPEPADPADLLSRVAEGAQDTVMELAWRVWPECHWHKLGLHTRSTGDGVVWWCRGGDEGGGEGHAAAEIGELAGTLPGKRRRELRRERRRGGGAGNRPTAPRPTPPEADSVGDSGPGGPS